MKQMIKKQLRQRTKIREQRKSKRRIRQKKRSRGDKEED